MIADLPNITIQDLLPHSEPMVLIDEVLSLTEKSISVKVDMSKPSLFSEVDGRVPSYVGIEFMAQALAALAGAMKIKNQQPVKLGFLLGTRKYQCAQSHFTAGQDLVVEVSECLRDDELAVFDCKIYGNELLSTAQIKAIQPKNVDSILQGRH